jgi:purine-binding chemotaxis protein CheW
VTAPEPAAAPDRSAVAAADAAEAAARPQCLVVACGGERYGIPIEQVREVVRPEGLVTVPGAPAVQAGIVNVRGAVVTVLDLAAVLGRPRAVTAGSIVLLAHGARPIGIAVDAVHDVRAIEAAADTRPLDAVALVGALLHSGEERER